MVGHKSNGDSIFRYISAPTQKELSAKLRQLTEAYKGVDLTEESNMSLSVWLGKWLDEYMAVTIRPSTLNGYRRSLELHVKPYLGNKTLSKITAVDLRSLYRSLQETGRVHPRDGQSPGLSARTVHGIHTTLHHALKTAMEQNLIPSNPAAEVDPPKFIGAPMKVLTEAQLDTFMTAIEKDEFWHDFFYTAVTTGLRRGEICALRWEDFDAKQETLHVRRTLHKEKGKPLTTGGTKTYAGTRKIILPPSTAEILRKRQSQICSPWIFYDPFRPELPINPSRAYYDSIRFVTRTRHSRSNLLNRIFITRGRRTVYSSSAWLIKETVHPLPSHYNKNKHSLRGFLSASGAMLILYQTKIGHPLQMITF